MSRMPRCLFIFSGKICSAMAGVHLLCGRPGSGKTTFARELGDAHRAVRYSNDDWIVQLFGRSPSAGNFKLILDRVSGAGKGAFTPPNFIMNLTVLEEGPERLEAYGTVPIAFTVRKMLRIDLGGQRGLGGIHLVEEQVSAPYVKDYDCKDGPARWRAGWDLTNWGIFSAFAGQERIGGAVAAFNTEGVDFLEGRKDLVALWDIRVVPRLRGRGVGTKLFHYALEWGRQRGCAAMKVETQNINLPACRFYQRQGCHLGAINRFAYRDFPGEAQLIWYRDL